MIKLIKNTYGVFTQLIIFKNQSIKKAIFETPEYPACDVRVTILVVKKKTINFISFSCKSFEKAYRVLK